MKSISGWTECGEPEAADLEQQPENWLLRQSEAVSRGELARFEALIDNDGDVVAGLAQVALEIAALYALDGEELPPALADEVAAVRKSGGVSAAVRRAEARGTRRAKRARLAQLRAAVDAGQNQSRTSMNDMSAGECAA
ncbi:hypothetical protein ACVDFE_00280 [Lentzea chajnantorensis]